MMLTFALEQGRFNFRVAGVARRGDAVLLHTDNVHGFWVLPGGRSEFGEPAADTLRREMQEELACRIVVQRLIWIVENFYQYEGSRVHELLLIYDMTLPDGSRPVVCDEFDAVDGTMKLLFRWFNLDELEGITLKPSFLATGLLTPPLHPTYIDHRG